MGTSNVVSSNEARMGTLCVIVLFSPSYLPQDSKWRADSKKFSRNKKLKKRQRNWRKLAGQTRRKRHKLPLRGNALCVSLKCRTRKPTSSISKASIQKHQCLWN